MGQVHPLIEGLYGACEWITRLVYISLLWLVFTLLGIGIFGIMPATSALFSIARKWVRQEDIGELYKVYWECYKRDFKTVNIIGFIFFAVGVLLAINIRILSYEVTAISTIIFIGTLIISLLYFIVLLHFFPVYAHYDLTIVNYFKHTLVIAVAQPLRTTMMFIWIMFVLIVSLFIPIMLPFFTIGLIGIGTSWIAGKGFFILQNKYSGVEN